MKLETVSKEKIVYRAKQAFDAADAVHAVEEYFMMRGELRGIEDPGYHAEAGNAVILREAAICMANIGNFLEEIAYRLKTASSEAAESTISKDEG